MANIGNQECEAYFGPESGLEELQRKPDEQIHQFFARASQHPAMIKKYGHAPKEMAKVIMRRFHERASMTPKRGAPIEGAKGEERPKNSGPRPKEPHQPISSKVPVSRRMDLPSRNARLETPEGVAPYQHARQPSSRIAPEKARQILHDGEVRGHELTDKQRKMFGAAASRERNARDENRHDRVKNPYNLENQNSGRLENQSSGATEGLSNLLDFGTDAPEAFQGQGMAIPRKPTSRITAPRPRQGMVPHARQPIRRAADAPPPPKPPAMVKPAEPARDAHGNLKLTGMSFAQKQAARRADNAKRGASKDRTIIGNTAPATGKSAADQGIDRVTKQISRQLENEWQRDWMKQFTPQVMPRPIRHAMVPRNDGPVTNFRMNIKSHVDDANQQIGKQFSGTKQKVDAHDPKQFLSQVERDENGQPTGHYEGFVRRERNASYDPEIESFLDEMHTHTPPKKQPKTMISPNEKRRRQFNQNMDDVWAKEGLSRRGSPQRYGMFGRLKDIGKSVANKIGLGGKTTQAGPRKDRTLANAIEEADESHGKPRTHRGGQRTANTLSHAAGKVAEWIPGVEPAKELYKWGGEVADKAKDVLLPRALVHRNPGKTLSERNREQFEDDEHQQSVTDWAKNEQARRRKNELKRIIDYKNQADARRKKEDISARRASNAGPAPRANEGVSGRRKTQLTGTTGQINEHRSTGGAESGPSRRKEAFKVGTTDVPRSPTTGRKVAPVYRDSGKPTGAIHQSRADSPIRHGMVHRLFGGQKQPQNASQRLQTHASGVKNIQSALGMSSMMKPRQPGQPPVRLVMVAERVRPANDEQRRRVMAGLAGSQRRINTNRVQAIVNSPSWKKYMQESEARDLAERRQENAGITPRHGAKTQLAPRGGAERVGARSATQVGGRQHTTLRPPARSEVTGTTLAQGAGRKKGPEGNVPGKYFTTEGYRKGVKHPAGKHPSMQSVPRKPPENIVPKELAKRSRAERDGIESRGTYGVPYSDTFALEELDAMLMN